MQRTTDLSSEFRQQSPEVLAVVTGLRPSREGGARVEMDEVVIAGEKQALVHNYGAGGTGFQAGYGMALDAVRVAEDILRHLKKEPVLSKL